MIDSDDAGRALPAIRDEALARLTAAGVSDPEVDADLLIGHVLGVSRGRVQALVLADAVLGPEQQASVRELIGRREKRSRCAHHGDGAVPLHRARGRTRRVRAPARDGGRRAVCDRLARGRGGARADRVDLGTGSGAIALAMAVEVPRARVYAVEKSPDAFVWTRRNVDRVGASNITAELADLVDALPELDGRVAVVISNPPYVPADAIPRDPEVRLFDPPQALYGGPDGLDVVRSVSHTACDCCTRAEHS